VRCSTARSDNQWHSRCVDLDQSSRSQPRDTKCLGWVRACQWQPYRAGPSSGWRTPGDLWTKSGDLWTKSTVHHHLTRWTQAQHKHDAVHYFRMTTSRYGQRMLDPSSFPCSSLLQPKLSPPLSGPLNSPTAAGFSAAGFGVRSRNNRPILSPIGEFSPKLGAWPIYSTSFFGSHFSALASFANRKVGIPFASCSLDREPPIR
jgi:hypothetical protein